MRHCSYVHVNKLLRNESSCYIEVMIIDTIFQNIEDECVKESVIKDDKFLAFQVPDSLSCRRCHTISRTNHRLLEKGVLGRNCNNSFFSCTSRHRNRKAQLPADVFVSVNVSWFSRKTWNQVWFILMMILFSIFDGQILLGVWDDQMIKNDEFTAMWSAGSRQMNLYQLIVIYIDRWKI